MSQHTAGPWAYDENLMAEGTFDIYGLREDGEYDPKIGEVYSCGADARLIAAAPELLEALRIADRALDVAGYQDVQPVRAAILAAIARVGG